MILEYRQYPLLDFALIHQTFLFRFITLGLNDLHADSADLNSISTNKWMWD